MVRYLPVIFHPSATLVKVHQKFIYIMVKSLSKKSDMNGGQAGNAQSQVIEIV